MQLRVPYMVVVIGSLLLGAALGAMGVLEPNSQVIELLLYVLVLSAGLGIGGLWGEKGVPSRKEVFSGLLLGIGVMTVSGLSGYILAVYLNLDPRLAFITGLASGWYSLAGPLVALHDSLFGLIAFFSNLMREFLHILLYPQIARLGWRCRGVSIGGATTMDTGLPVVVKSGDARAILVALAQGAAITGVAPVIASLVFH